MDDVDVDDDDGDNGDGKRRGEGHLQQHSTDEPSLSDQSSSHTSKRRRLLGTRQRRYLVVPSSEEELDGMENAYSLFNEGYGNNIGQNDNDDEENDVWQQACVLEELAATSQRSRRPLPPVQVISSLVAVGTSTAATSNTATPVPFNPHQSPLMQKFYKSIGIDNPSVGTTATGAPEGGLENNGDNNTDRVADLDDIDNPALSTLTVGQHRRYLQLTDSQQTDRRTAAQRKELNSLKDHVVQEQEAYAKAVDRFHEVHKSRYRTGMDHQPIQPSTGGPAPAAAFCRWACSNAQAISQRWRECLKGATDLALPSLYGKTSQILSLHRPTTSLVSSHGLDVQDLMCKVVHEEPPMLLSTSTTTPTGRRLTKCSTLPDVGSRLRPPPLHGTAAPSIGLLRNDTTALKLAAAHSASIVTTLETLEVLLRMPGDYSSQWMLTVKKVPRPAEHHHQQQDDSVTSSVVLLDLPIAQAYSTPRECLEKGLQEGLYQAMSGENTTGENGGDAVPGSAAAPSFVYSLWTLPNPPSATNKKRVNVLIRVPVRSVDPTTKRPQVLRAHVEYFWHGRAVDGTNRPAAAGAPPPPPDHGREIPNSYETALWILDHVLLGNEVSSHWYRIDPDTCSVLERDVVSIAHAFAISNSRTTPQGGGGTTGDPLDHWQTTIQLLHAILTIDVPDSLLCLPGRITSTPATTTTPGGASNSTDDPRPSVTVTKLDPFSVSVHAAIAPAAPSNAVIDVESMLERAGAVLLNDSALRDCRREWEWHRPEQIPNTFPI
jgi:hypothetical protein